MFEKAQQQHQRPTAAEPRMGSRIELKNVAIGRVHNTA